MNRDVRFQGGFKRRCKWENLGSLWNNGALCGILCLSLIGVSQVWSERGVNKPVMNRQKEKEQQKEDRVTNHARWFGTFLAGMARSPRRAITPPSHRVALSSLTTRTNFSTVFTIAPCWTTWQTERTRASVWIVHTVCVSSLKHDKCPSQQTYCWNSQNCIKNPNVQSC